MEIDELAKRAIAEQHERIETLERQSAGWKSERAQAVAMLREACKDYGDNDWPDNLHLADVIEKHLLRHLPNR